MSAATILVVDDDPQITEALSLLLEQPGRRTVTCADVQAAEIVLATTSVTHVVTDVQFTGPFGFEGLHFVRRLCRGGTEQRRVVIMSGNVSAELRQAGLAAGAAAVLQKPFSAGELVDALFRSGGEATEPPYHVDKVPGIDDLLRPGSLRTVFQPIVRVSGGEVIAFEALTRLHDAPAPLNPERLFEYAEKSSRLVELNQVATALALEAARDLPSQTDLFLNVDPAFVSSSRFADLILEESNRNGIEHDRLVLEITERSEIISLANVLPAFERLRSRGVRFAFDDFGSAYSHLPLIDLIRPSFIKIAQSFGTDFENDPARARIIDHVTALAASFGAETILEGVETEQTRDAAAQRRISLAQGYLFGFPSDVRAWTTAGAVAA